LQLRSPSDKILEPKRLTAIDSEGVPYALYSGGERLDAEDFPVDPYFYHFSKVDNFDSIRRYGLRSSGEQEGQWKRDNETVKPGESRLYLFAMEYNCLEDVYFASGPELVGLKFNRNVVKEKEKIFDGRYGVDCFSFYVTHVMIPVDELQVCFKPEWVGGSEKIRGVWTALTQWRRKDSE